MLEVTTSHFYLELNVHIILNKKIRKRKVVKTLFLRKVYFNSKLFFYK